MMSDASNLAPHREALIAELRGALPMFWVVHTSETGTVLRGPLSVTDASGAEIETFTIEVAVPDAYPREIPVVTEVNGRIPPIEDRHINGRGGSCCIELPFEFHRRHPQLSVSDYLLGPVRSFFLAQLHFEQFGTWPAGDRGHGFDGVREAMLELFGLDDAELLIKLLPAARNWRKRKRDPCPCGSAARLFACHGKRVRAAVREWPEPAVECLLEMLSAAPPRRSERLQIPASQLLLL
jgi:hypothetical protein